MDLADLESNLHSLEKLYELLLRNYDDEYHEPYDKLDDGARYMLKKLLDMETERVIKAHSEIVESKGIYGSRSSQQLKDDGMSKKFHAGEFPFEAPIDNREGLTSDLSFPLTEEQSIYDPTSPTEKVNQSNMIFAASAFMNKKKRCRICKQIKSKPSCIFSDRGGTHTPYAVNDLHPGGFIIKSGEHNKKGSDDYTNIPFIVPSSSSKENLCNQRGGTNNSTSAVISKSLPSHSASEASAKMEETNSFCKEEAELVSGDASAAVKKIKSHIARMHWLRLLFKVDAEILLPPKKRATRCGLRNVSIGLMAPVTDSDVPSMLLKGGKEADDDASGQARKTISSSLSLPRHNMMGQIESEQKIGGNSCETDRKQTLQEIIPSQAMRTPSNRFESLCNRIVPGDILPSQKPKVRGFGFQENEPTKSNWCRVPTARLMKQKSKEDQNNQVCWNSKGSRMNVVDHTSHIIHPTRIRSRRLYVPPDSPRLAMEEHETSQASVSSLHDNLFNQHQTSFSDNNNKTKRRMRKELIDPGEIVSTDSDYSRRTNQIIGDSSNEIDLNSSSSEIHTSETPSSRFESDDVYSLPRRTRRLPASATSSSESEIYSSASRSDSEIYSSTSSSGSRQDTSTNSIERRKYSSDVRPGTKHNRLQSYSSDDSASSRKGGGVPTKTSQNSRNKKRHGGLKKLKDKLSIIFHHHHHHHHHLHHGDNNDQSNSAGAKINHGKSLWKRSSKVAQLKRENEIKGEHAVEKLGKSIIRDKKRKKQHGHFYELMKGMLRQKRHSKQSKSSKLAAKQSRIHHESKKARKTSHWWKLLRKQKRSKKRMIK